MCILIVVALVRFPLFSYLFFFKLLFSYLCHESVEIESSVLFTIQVYEVHKISWFLTVLALI